MRSRILKLYGKINWIIRKYNEVETYAEMGWAYPYTVLLSW
jgi:hypothetical protein